jgi:hypothetical protein
MPPHTHGIRNSQRRSTKSKHKEARALKEKEELVAIVRGTLQENACQPGNKREWESGGSEGVPSVEKGEVGGISFKVLEWHHTREWLLSWSFLNL